MISRVRLPDRQSGRFLSAGLTALRRSLFDFISYGIVGYPRGKYLVMVLVSETLGVYGNIFSFQDENFTTFETVVHQGFGCKALATTNRSFYFFGGYRSKFDFSRVMFSS